MTDNNTALAHKEQTLQDVFDEMTPEQKDFQALLVGAAVSEDDVSFDSSVLAEYEALPQINKHLIDFLVGNILADKTLEHNDPIVDNFLSHFGVKGMKWGERKTSSTANSSARAKVKSGSATLGEAHGAALKTTGHRAINAFTGDKTFWKRTAITAGVAATVAGAAAAAPFVLPASTLVGIGSFVTGATSVGGVGLVNGSLVSMSQVGAAALAGAGVTTATIGAGVATVGNVVGNTSRAIQGNSRINKSLASLGSTVTARQTEGNARVKKMLSKDGSLSKKDLKHGDVLGSFLSKHADVTLTTQES